MTLRLVLVSLVAALGLSIPGGPMIESWVATTQNWMNARFADWDTRNPREADYVIISDRYDMPVAGPRQDSGPDATSPETPAVEPAVIEAKPARVVSFAVASTTGRGVVRPASFVRRLAAFTPISTVATDLPGIAFADELNRRHDGIGSVPPPVAQRPGVLPRSVPSGAIGTTYAMVAFETRQGTPAAKPARPVVAPAPAPVRFTPIVVAEGVDAGIAYELNRMSEGLDLKQVAAVIKKVDPVQVTLASTIPAPLLVPVAAAAKSADLASFGPMETSESLYFAEPLERAAPMVAAQSPARAVEQAADAFIPVATLDAGEDLFVETAAGILIEADGFSRGLTATEVLPPTLAPAKAPAAIARKFEPIEVGEDHSVGIAHELNRRNDGISVPAAGVAQAKPAPKKPTLPAPELSRAVKLTGEAVYAWVSVLTGPALVTVTK